VIHAAFFVMCDQRATKLDQGESMTHAAEASFNELQAFWKDVYADLEPGQDLTKALNAWVPTLIERDSQGNAQLQRQFSAKLPEPYFGRWVDDAGRLCLRRKTVVVLINPGNGMPVHEYDNSGLSLLGVPVWRVWKEFYTRGRIEQGGASHWLPYKRSLSCTKRSSNGARRYAWGWWAGQWENMMRALGQCTEDDEEESFVTLELFAYSSSSAKGLSVDAARTLRSTDLVTKLIVSLLNSPPEHQPRGIVLVNKVAIWQEVLRHHGFTLAQSPSSGRSRRPRAFVVCRGEQQTAVPAVLLHQAQGMKFPRPGNGAEAIFARWRAAQLEC
jgi:hypothetical protein